MRQPITVRNFTHIEGQQVLIRATTYSSVDDFGALRAHTDPSRWDLVATDVNDNILAAWAATGYNSGNIASYLSDYAVKYVADRLNFIANG